MQNTISKIGLLSDSHGQAQRTHSAVQTLVKAGAEILIHLGDINSTTVLDSLALDLDEAGELKPPVEVVLGNTDWNSAELINHAQHLGIGANEVEGRLQLSGKTIVFQHGHHYEKYHAAIQEKVDFLFHGHTHTQIDEYVERTRVINPGALQRAREYTVALLDLETLALERFTIT